MSWVKTGATEPITVFILDSSGDPLTALTDVYVRLRRLSDGFYYDWATATFKAAGWTTLNQLLTEVDAVYSPGEYEVTGGLLTTGFSGRYIVSPLQTPGTNAKLPAPAELEVGGWVDETYTGSTAAQAAAADSEIVRKIADNQQVLTAGIAANFVVKDDDDIADFRTYNMTDRDGNAIFLPEGAPARRSKGV